jgi:hypothetical protein
LNILTVIASRAAARQPRLRRNGYAVWVASSASPPRNDGEGCLAALLITSAVLFTSPALADEPADLHARMLTLDSHIDIPAGYATPAADPGVRGEMQVDLPKMA